MAIIKQRVKIMAAAIPRAQTIRMFFGVHEPEYSGKFRQCFAAQPHPAGRKVFVVEGGNIEQSALVNYRKDIRTDISISLRQQGPTRGLVQAIKDFNEASRKDLFTIAAEVAAGKSKARDVRDDVAAEAIRAGYELRTEKVLPEAILIWWKAVNFSLKASELLFVRSGAFDRAVINLTWMYEKQYESMQLRDLTFIAYLDLLVEQFDAVSAARGVFHIPFYRAVHDPPRMIRFSDEPSFLGDVFMSGVAPGQLGDEQKAMLVKHMILMSLLQHRAAGRAAIELNAAYNLIDMIPCRLATLETFLTGLNDPSPDRAAGNILAKLRSL